MARKKKVEDPDKVELTELYPDDEGGSEDYDAEYVKRFILQCREESDLAKFDRMQQNKANFDLYHGRHDFSHKIPGQSCETLNMQAMAVESTASFFQQALVDEGEWWSAQSKDPRTEEKMKVSVDVISELTQDQLEKADILRHVGLATKSGLLGALQITKVECDYISLPAYVVTRSPNARKAKLKKINKKSWRLKLAVIPQKNYYPDPTGSGLYEIEDMWIDYHKLCELSEGPDAIYDPAVVADVECAGGTEDSEEAIDAQRRTGQNPTDSSFRNRVKLTEFWGTILDEDGEVLCENVVATLANDQWLVRAPTPNPNWDQESPFVCGALMDVPDSVWPKALMDHPTRHNTAINEVYNLMLDGAMRAANGVGMLRHNWIDNPQDAEKGIRPGTTFKINDQAPPGAKVYEMVQTGVLPPDTTTMYNIQRQEFNASALTSDIRQGIMPKKEVAATQIVETSQTITSVFQGITKRLEQTWLKKVLMKSCYQTMQFSDEIDESEIRSVLGDRADGFLKLTPEERFAETVQGTKFNVFGISQQVAREQDFRKIATLLQTIGASQVFMDAYLKKFSPERTLEEAMRGLKINTRRLEISPAEQAIIAGEQAQQPAGPQGPDQMSQVQSPNTGSLAEQLGAQAGPMAQAQAAAAPGGGEKFPPSKATPKGGY